MQDEHGDRPVRGPFSVILEVPGQPPELVATLTSEIKAGEMAVQIAFRYKHIKGTRVSLRTPDSADQLQVTRNGTAVRDQLHLHPVGENVVIAVPTARANAKIGDP